MPPMKSKLGETDVVQLVALVRNFRGGQQIVPDDPEDEKNSAKSSERNNKTARKRCRSYTSAKLSGDNCTCESAG